MRGFRNSTYCLFLLTIVSVLLSFNMRSASAADVSECAVTEQSDDVILVICPPDLTQDDWKIAGENACSSNAGICNVWIWDDVEKAPQEAPVTDSDMNKDKVREALAVWVNDANRLIILGKVDK